MRRKFSRGFGPEAVGLVRGRGVAAARAARDRDGGADRPDQKRLAHFTCIRAAEAWLDLAVVRGLFSRRGVGWSRKAERDAPLVMEAPMMAVRRRGKADALLHHPDQGSQTPAPGSGASGPVTASPAR